MDGRIQEPLRKFATKRFGVQFVDAVTDRGGLLRHLPEIESKGYIENMLTNIKVSRDVHHSKGVVMAGHQKCAGYNIPDEQKKKEVLEAANLIRRELPELEVIPVFVTVDSAQVEVL